jgi:hypothetical protein
MRSQNGIFTEIMTIAPNAGTTTDKFYEAGDILIDARQEGARNPVCAARVSEVDLAGDKLLPPSGRRAKSSCGAEQVWSLSGRSGHQWAGSAEWLSRE